MRLLNTSTYELHDYGEAVPEYAILSHRWQPPEISFESLNAAELRDPSRQTPQLDKIRKACAKARERMPPLDWLWMDTCCIDKKNAVEETKSINSMFEWYYRATVCYAYLLDVDKSIPSRQIFESQNPKRHQQKSEWFERGWTLQELLAPQNMEFYDRNWKFMGTKKELSGALQSVTGIDGKYLAGQISFKTASVATRMSWMAGRTTTVVEDIAYSMIGLLNVNLTLQYGEGVKAFIRLQRTLMENSTDESIFAWTIPTQGLLCYRGLGQTPQWAPKSWGLLAPSPDCFGKYGDLVILEDKVVPRLYTWTQQGMQFQMPLKSGTEATNFFGLPRSEVTFTLNCWRYDASGKPLTIQLQLVKNGAAYNRVQCNDLGQKKGAKPSTNSVMGIDQALTRTLTIAQPKFDPLV